MAKLSPIVLLKIKPIAQWNILNILAYNSGIFDYFSKVEFLDAAVCVSSQVWPRLNTMVQCPLVLYNI